MKRNARAFGSTLATATVAMALLGCSASGVAPQPAEPPAPQRALDMHHGQLLYETYCGGCHTSQAHWRDNSIVAQWSELLAQVDRWQRNAGQQWPPSDVEDVAAYLNIVYYKFPCPSPGCRGDVVTRWDRGVDLASRAAMPAEIVAPASARPESF